VTPTDDQDSAPQPPATPPHSRYGRSGPNFEPEAPNLPTGPAGFGLPHAAPSGSAQWGYPSAGQSAIQDDLSDRRVTLALALASLAVVIAVIALVLALMN
jgi:hypothetical protein